jgi:hydrophobic/amphiphilic exporter-1 (mainly G- bacteria), HAE1 family
MSLPALCIRRPVFTVMLILLPVIFGLIALRRMGVGLFPNVDLPIVLVTVNRPGASADEMETGVTKLLEEEINTISEIDELRSVSTEGLCQITVVFKLSKSGDVGFQEVQSKVDRLRARLPSGTEAPLLEKFDVNAAPVLTVAISGERPLRELTEIAIKEIGEELSGAAGVGAVTVVGGRRRAINVTVDARRLDAFDLSIAQVRDGLRAENVELPGGRVAQERRELVLRTLGRVTDPRELAEVIVANRGGQPVRVKDLGRPADGQGEEVVADTFEEPRTIARLNGRNSVTLVVQKQSGTNTVEVIDAVKARLAQVEATFARTGRGDVHLEVIRDQSIFVKRSLHEVQVHLMLGAGLVVLTILLFLRDWRATLIAAVAIPTSLLAAFPVMSWFHLTIDNITLIALVLVIGIVIDDAVIVIENVFRWIHERGRPPLEAALEGTKEITLAVVATTLSLTVIFVPIAFMSGTVGLFLRAFGITCSVCILVSMVVSLTLTPMLSSRMLKRAKGGDGGSVARHAAGGDDDAHDHPRTAGVYGWLIERPWLLVLRASMRQRWIVVLASIVSVASIFPWPVFHFRGLGGMVGLDFVPKDDQSEFQLALIAPEGWSLERVDGVVRTIEERVRSWPEVTDVLTQIGDTTGRIAKGEGAVTSATIYIRLVSLEERRTPFTQFDLMARARKLLQDDPDLRSSVQIVKAVSGGGFSNNDLEFLLIGPDLDALHEYADRMLKQLRTLPGLADLDTTLSDRRPELRVAVDRERANDLGVSISTVAATLRTLVGGEIVSDYKDLQTGEQYDVWLRARGIDRGDPEAIGNLAIPTTSGRLVPLASVATAGEGLGPAQIDRAARQRKISLVANLAGMPTAAATAAFMKAFADLDAPPTYSLVATGSAKNAAESNQAFVFAFGLSLVLMYMILAAQFESFVHPITILLAVPLTIPFALVSQLLFGTPLTLFSLLGLFLLFGIVKKNGILQVDYVNTLRARAAADRTVVPALYREGDAARARGGFERWVCRLPERKRVRLWAILESNRVRLRPILMTTIMLVAAMVPIALGKGPGAANRADMAKVIIGGQSLSLLLSLLITPVAYSLFDDLSPRSRNSRNFRQTEPREELGGGPAGE